MSFKLFIGYQARAAGYNIGSGGSQSQNKGRKTKGEKRAQKAQEKGANDNKRYFETNASASSSVGEQITVIISSDESGDEHSGPFLEPLSGER